jgi:hypothetical protein
MNRPTLFILIALNALFVTVLAGEWFAETETSITQKVEPKNSDEVEIEDLSTLDALTEVSEEDYSDLVERPMFIKGRKAVREPEPENTPAVVTKTDVFVWNLTGIFSTPKGMTAFLNRTNAKVEKDNYRKIKVGEELDGWKMTDIQSDKVILTQAGETKTLLLRKAKPKMSAQPILSKQTAPLQAAVQQETPTLQVPAVPQNSDDLSDETVNPENQ